MQSGDLRSCLPWKAEGKIQRHFPRPLGTNTPFQDKFSATHAPVSVSPGSVGGFLASPLLPWAPRGRILSPMPPWRNTIKHRQLFARLGVLEHGLPLSVCLARGHFARPIAAILGPRFRQASAKELVRPRRAAWDNLAESRRGLKNIMRQKDCPTAAAQQPQKGPPWAANIFRGRAPRQRRPVWLFRDFPLG